ncbi:UNVERIFIED_CONTAM: hypothetical protein GTU68_052968 [Idotea baltica]|nr:hypothetical protein [Idotea baltica]
MKLELNMSRGQPSVEQFDLSNEMLETLGAKDYIAEDGLDCRNYPGGICGLAEAREYFSKFLEVPSSQTLVGNNASIEIMQDILVWAMLRGLPGGTAPWSGQSPKFLCPVPGYDRHYTMLEALGIEMIPVALNEDGPDMEQVSKLVAKDASIKGIWCVPKYSNPTGITYSDEVVDALAQMKTAAGDFRIFWDNAYALHHFCEKPQVLKNLYASCEAAGNANRAYIFGSTSKITFAGAGLCYMGCSPENLAQLSELFGTQSIGPNKLNQLRHVRFLKAYPGGVEGLMKKHAEIVKPKFEAMLEVLEAELGGTELASWSKPEGGYFISFDTKPGMASKVVALAKETGVVLTPAGATFPYGKDEQDTNIRIAPTKPTLEEIKLAAEVIAVCVKVVSSKA